MRAEQYLQALLALDLRLIHMDQLIYFLLKSYIKTVIIESGVTSIEGRAFSTSLGLQV